MQGKQPEVFKADITTKEMYEYYARKTFKTKINKNYRINKDSPFFMSKVEYTKILKMFNKSIRDMMLYSAFEFRIPCRLGNVSIVKKKAEPYFDKDGKLVNPTPIDRKATKELWDRDPDAKKRKLRVFHNNTQSGGYIAKLHYHKNTSKFVNKSGYNLKNSRDLKLLIRDIMNDPLSPYDFFTVENYKI